MITHCKECDTYFRVSVEQLKAANGQVKCGCCMTVFNAIDSLLENQENQENPEQADIPPSDQTTESDFDITDDSDLEIKDEEILDDEAISLFEEDDEISHQLDDQEDEVLPLNAEEDTEEIAILDNEADPEDAADFEIGSLDLDMIEQGIEQQDEKASTGMNILWASAAVLLLGLLGFQYAKYNSTDLITQFPELKEYCYLLDCPQEIETQSNSAIRLVSRDVREHPQFQNILLVNAILMNGEDQKQDFPALQLDFFDNVGRPVGSRIFQPTEYLDSSVDIQRGMQPELPVHVVLEVVGNGQETSSFEFNFL